MTSSEYFQAYFAKLSDCGRGTLVTWSDGHQLAVPDALDWVIKTVRDVHQRGNKVMFIGNGGSAGIASHMAIDYSKNGSFRALAFNDSAALTCLSNDLGYDNVFAKQIAMHAWPGDFLVAISSSGKSTNILSAVTQARLNDCHVLTLSGFSDDNPLRKMGDLNFYVPASEYGFVEITHLALLHAILDRAMGIIVN